MIADTRTEAGANIALRSARASHEARQVPPGTWMGILVRLRPKGAEHHHDVAYIDPKPQPEDSEYKAGWRHITIWADKERQGVLAVVDTESADRSRGVYRILDDSGAVLARVVRDRGRIRPPRRTWWTVEVTGGPTLRAVKGTVRGWWAWWALSPLWLVATAVSILGGDIFWRMPIQTVFRQGAEPYFRWEGTSAPWQGYVLEADWPDPRVPIALAALHQSLPGWYDSMQ